VNYQEFLETKMQVGVSKGFEPEKLNPRLFDFQKFLVSWALKQGRGAEFIDTGLGKTAMQLEWSQKIIEKTNKPVLLLTPLAVGTQTLKESVKFDVDAQVSRDGQFTGKRVVITNYERLHYFKPEDFGGVACDESSIIKNYDGVRRAEVTEFMRTSPYRSLWTATAAPNDYVELGTSSEALGEMGQIDMLNSFFKNDANNSNMKRDRRNGGKAAGWRFKGHAEESFWRWVCSWARACRKPSDLGFDDSKFVLPPLMECDHIVEARTPSPEMLFAMPASNFREEREERRRTINERCELVAKLADTDKPVVIWCHLNDEGDMIEETIPGSVQVSGKETDEEKEEAFTGFSEGKIRALIIKPKIGAWGLNWQHCSHVITFASHSYEQYYQSVRRCWRFGQKNRVIVDLISSEGEVGVKENMKRKAVAADRMFSKLVEMMNNSLSIKREEKFKKMEEVPAWL